MGQMRCLVVNFNCHLGDIWNHLGCTSLNLSVKGVPKRRLIEMGKPILNTGILFHGLSTHTAYKTEGKHRLLTECCAFQLLHTYYVLNTLCVLSYYTRS